MKTKVQVTGAIVAAILLVVGVFTSARAQTATTQNPPSETQPAQPQAPNLQTELNLSPDQIQKWRALNRELKDQEVAGNLRVREARRALTEAMEAPSPNEDLIKQRAKELADAQSAMTQLNALRQARVLQILTPEQRIKLKEIRERQREEIQARRNAGQQLPNNGLRRQNTGQRNVNTVAPMTPKQRKLLKQPPKQ